MSEISFYWGVFGVIYILVKTILNLCIYVNEAFTYAFELHHWITLVRPLKYLRNLSNIFQSLLVGLYNPRLNCFTAYWLSVRSCDRKMPLAVSARYVVA